MWLFYNDPGARRKLCRYCYDFQYIQMSACLAEEWLLSHAPFNFDQVRLFWIWAVIWKGIVFFLLNVLYSLPIVPQQYDLQCVFPSYSPVSKIHMLILKPHISVLRRIMVQSRKMLSSMDSLLEVDQHWILHLVCLDLELLSCIVLYCLA